MCVGVWVASVCALWMIAGWWIGADAFVCFFGFFCRFDGVDCVASYYGVGLAAMHGGFCSGEFWCCGDIDCLFNM